MKSSLVCVKKWTERLWTEKINVYVPQTTNAGYVFRYSVEAAAFGVCRWPFFVQRSSLEDVEKRHKDKGRGRARMKTSSIEVARLMQAKRTVHRAADGI